MVVVGVGRHPDTSETGMWFHVDGEPGAGIFDSEILNRYRMYMEVEGKVKINPLSATEQQQLIEYSKMVRKVQRSEMNMECFFAWRAAKAYQKSFQPQNHAAFPWPTKCDFGYAMSTGSQEEDVPPVVFSHFDKRQDALAVFTVQDGIKLQHGMTLTIPNKDGQSSSDYVVIGTRPILPGVRCAIWAEKVGGQGAQPLSVKQLSRAKVANKPPVAVKEADPKDFQASEPEIIPEHILEFEAFIRRAERAVVRRVKPKKKNADGAKKAEAGKEEEKKDEGGPKAAESSSK
eukprot:TRINITY_DN47790_c0_g1_i1.p1 TRINITY_DN47790_c0_g1~~TRINITY_DN47790_c0_g1_i1.p1  ORF type:complete len:339 (+),score=75.82 TRINITY_DN47790_c0_g1_i1:151-1017(+)